MISVCFQGKPFNTTVTQVYAPTTKPKKLNLNDSMKTYFSFFSITGWGIGLDYRDIE